MFKPTHTLCCYSKPFALQGHCYFLYSSCGSWPWCTETSQLSRLTLALVARLCWHPRYWTCLARQPFSSSSICSSVKNRLIVLYCRGLPIPEGMYHYPILLICRSHSPLLPTLINLHHIVDMKDNHHNS